eukprot:13875201-Alexandrium_andersonii.AAC.1
MVRRTPLGSFGRNSTRLGELLRWCAEFCPFRRNSELSGGARKRLIPPKGTDFRSEVQTSASKRI